MGRGLEPTASQLAYPVDRKQRTEWFQYPESLRPVRTASVRFQLGPPSIRIAIHSGWLYLFSGPLPRGVSKRGAPLLLLLLQGGLHRAVSAEKQGVET